MKVSKKFKMVIGNVIYAFIAQGISLLLSVLMSLVVPKLLGVEQFGYWQLFLFYSSYVGFFHFGLNDGIYLKYGGVDYKNLNFNILCSQFWLTCIIQFIFALVISIVSFIFIEDLNRQYVFICTAFFLVISNMAHLLGYIFQATNKVKVYSTSVIIDKVLFILSVIVLLFLKVEYFKIFVILYLVAKLISLIYCVVCAKEIVFSKVCSLKITIRECILNISKGIYLTISNIASMLILGIGRMFIDKTWGIEAFGKFSFSLSLTSFFLLFISQVSMVLFPTLRQVNGKRQKDFYIVSRNLLGIFLAGVLLFYVPVNYIIGLWLPQYSESLRYLILLLPLCTFDGKMQMLCNTYLKVLRKEKVLLKINLLSVSISIILSLIGVYIFKSIYFVVIFMVISVAVRSIVAEIYLAKIMKCSIIKDILIEVLLVIIFIIFTWFFESKISFSIYFINFIIYLFVKKRDIKETKKLIFGNVKKD